MAKIEFSPEDEVFFGTVMGTADLITFEGNSVKELICDFHEAIDGYLESCKRLGKEPDKMYKGTFNVRISPELHKQASVYAEQEGMSLNEYVADSIRKNVAGYVTTEDQLSIALSDYQSLCNSNDTKNEYQKQPYTYGCLYTGSNQKVLVGGKIGWN
ncbi:type II toxin-antitoxin system HicB family antitoxin [Caproicibacterium sp. NSD3]